jgi:hypothetical protein
MSALRIAAIIGVALSLAACQAIPREQTVGQYCAKPDHANKDVCKINVEIDGQKRALADTNVSLSQARALAEEAKSAAAAAQSTADQAMARQDAIYCETRTLQRTNIGSCSPGYKLVSCTQSRFTYKAGGPSIMRTIDDEQCRFHDRVLEIKVRCCMAGSAPLPTEADTSTPAAATQPQQSS